MNLPQLSKALTSIYNTLGNEWITENLVSEPFRFRVYVRRADPYDYSDIVAQVFTDRPIPQTFVYKNPETQKSQADGIHYTVLMDKFKQLANYIDTFGTFQKTFGVEFMDLARK